jgi:hypothetical protein
MSLAIRVATLKDNFGAGKEFPQALQVSMDTLNWWTVGRFKTDVEAIGHAKELANFVSTNRIVKEEHVLWQTRL